MKKLILLLLLSVLTVRNVNDIYASSGGGVSFGMDADCPNCNGAWSTKYSSVLTNIYTWKAYAHFQYSNGTIGCKSYVAGLGVNGDKLYMIQLDKSDSLEIGYIYISEDEKIEYYDSEGNIVTKTLNNFTSSGYGGESNGKTFGSWIHTFVNKPYEMNYCDGFEFVIDCTSMSFTEQKGKLDELARYLCGENTEMPDGVTIGKLPDLYDLECPLDIKVNTGSATVNVEGDGYTNIKSGSATLIPFKIWWSQSNIDLSGYETEFYIKEFGKCRKSIFDKWEDVNTGWVYDGTHVTAKYCNNNLKWHEFRCWESPNLKEVAITQLGDDDPKVEFNSCDFMIRNKKEDENGRMHYSNWVYVNTYDDGTYSVYEMVQDYDITEDSDETGSINTDSTIHDDEIIHVDSDTSIDVGGIGNAGTFLTVLKDLANSIKTFPDFFGEVFSFLPSWILTSIGILFIIVLVCAIF